jgi:hypothetical protein
VNITKRNAEPASARSNILARWVETKALVRAVKRNIQRFLDKFIGVRCNPRSHGSNGEARTAHRLQARIAGLPVPGTYSLAGGGWRFQPLPSPAGEATISSVMRALQRAPLRRRPRRQARSRRRTRQQTHHTPGGVSVTFNVSAPLLLDAKRGVK